MISLSSTERCATSREQGLIKDRKSNECDGKSQKRHRQYPQSRSPRGALARTQE